MLALQKLKRRFLRLRGSVLGGLLYQSLQKSTGTQQVDKVNKIIAAQCFFQLPTFVETGTYFGTTLIAVYKHFLTSYSIELNHELATEAQIHFQNHTNVTVIEGDSGTAMDTILKSDSTKKLFWLDAHYSGGITAQSKDFGHTPISKELETILAAWVKGSVILIDDARLFVGTDNYPTLADLNLFIEAKSDLRVFVDKDIIHIY